MKVSDYIARFLEAQGTQAVFELSGGMITHLLDSLHRCTQVRVVSMHHEQGAAFAADGYGRMTGTPGVAMATSGPGATNLLTGIGSCHFDSVPAVFITGQVNRHEQRGDRAIRQLGFQETDIVPMVKSITKGAKKLGEVDEVAGALAEAYELAIKGRPGPVLLDIPMDIQRGETEAPILPLNQITKEPIRCDVHDHTEQFLTLLKKARRPLILAGGGVQASRSLTAFRECVTRLGVPVVHSLLGVDALPFLHPCRVGMIGSYGNRWANLALAEADLVLVVGSRLDVRQTGSETGSFATGKVIIHVDCEPAEINNRITGCIAVVSGLQPFFDSILEALPSESTGDTALGEWLDYIRGLRERWPDTGELAGIQGINPNQFFHDLSRVSPEAAAFVVDVGQHQMWAAQSLELGDEQRFLTSGGMGSMGYALPASIGASIASGDAPVVVVAGDGGFQCNIQELQTVVRNQLPLKIVVMNNQCHGMVRQFQENYFEGRYQSTLWGYSAPDFAKVAEAYGLPSRRVIDPSDVSAALKWLWSTEGPALLEVGIDTHANAYPKIAFGHPISEMEPFARPREMEGT